ncbi:MAG TPA: pilus assembly protein PilM [Bacillota bacterium]|nr:pilus assembly protein PilM [Bacillota bacterium]
MPFLRKSAFTSDKSFAAVDIGASRIKIIEIKVRRKRAFIDASIACPTPEGSLSGGIRVEELSDAVKEAVRSAGLGCKRIVTSVGSEQAFVAIIKLPEMPPRELAGAVRWEAEKYIAVPVEDTVLRYFKLSESKVNGSKQFDMLIASVPKETVYGYLEIFARAGLEVTAIDIQAFALWRALVRNKAGAASSAVVDVGKQSANIVISDRGNISYVTCFSADQAGAFESSSGDRLKKGGFFIDKFINSGKEEEDWPGRGDYCRLFGRIKDAIGEYVLQNRGIPLEKVILTGGASKLDGAVPYLSASLRLPVEIGFPEMPVSDGRGLERRAVDPSFSVAVGLALREVTARVQA